MLNHIVVMGRLTRDPELRMTQTGTPVVSFTVAVDRDFADRETGSRQTDFIDVVAWRNTAEFISRNFNKGKMAIVLGRLQIRDWVDKEGAKRRNAEIVADTVYFGESRQAEEARANSYGGGYNQQQGGGYGGGQQSGSYGNSGGYGGQQGGGYGSQSNQGGYQSGYGNSGGYDSGQNSGYQSGYNSNQGYNTYPRSTEGYAEPAGGYGEDGNAPAAQVQPYGAQAAPPNLPPQNAPVKPVAPDSAFTELDDPELPF